MDKQLSKESSMILDKSDRTMSIEKKTMKLIFNLLYLLTIR
jgi:hypothetical protein